MEHIIVHKGLKPRYWWRALLWKIIVKKILKAYANGWEETPLVAYPLMIDLELGGFKYYYLKHGFIKSLRRVSEFNKVIVDRLHEKHDDVDPDELKVKVKLRGEAMKDELEKELREFY